MPVLVNRRTDGGGDLFDVGRLVYIHERIPRNGTCIIRSAPTAPPLGASSLRRHPAPVHAPLGAPAAFRCCLTRRATPGCVPTALRLGVPVLLHLPAHRCVRE